MSLGAHLAGLRQRFDALALRPPAWAADSAAQQQRSGKTHAALQAWCWLGAGSGHVRWWQPGALPQVAQRLAVATLTGAAGDTPADLQAWADAVALQLDGSVQLQALPGRAAGLLFRLRVKLQDALWWRARRPADPWDAGWAINSAPALRQLGSHFQPRRATLILADARLGHGLQPALAALAQRQQQFRHPVRWLWVAEDGAADRLPAPGGLPITRFSLA